MPTAQQNIVILTGAGISAESGIQTFRASDGLWHEHHVNDVATPEGFARDPELVHQFYNERRRQLFNGDIHPNAAHYALDVLEQKKGDNVLVITQNIDNLHEEAGSKNLIHMHGELSKVRCQNSANVYECFDDISIQSVCKCCQISGSLRPHIVWFGEMPLEMDRINSALANCDVFISIGTSGLVYPAAGFVAAAKHVGAKTVELNLEASQNSCLFDESINGLASEIVPEYIEKKLL